MHLDFCPGHDIEICRDMAVKPEAIWTCWSDPIMFENWFCLSSEELLLAEVNFQPGGIFRVKKRIQNGLTVDSTSCFLQAELDGKIVFTDALGAGFHPNPHNNERTVAFVWQPCKSGTRVTVRALGQKAYQPADKASKNFMNYWESLLGQLASQAQKVTIRRAYAGTSFS